MTSGEIPVDGVIDAHVHLMPDRLMTANDLPFLDDELDALFSTMTFHEFAEDEAVAELARVLSPGSTVVTSSASNPTMIIET